MVKLSRRMTVMIMIAVFLIYPIYLFWAFLQMSTEGFVPLFGLPLFYHNLVLYVVFPIFVPMLCAFVFPRLFTFLYMGFMRSRFVKFRFAYLGFEVRALSLKKWVWRGLQVFLLTIGLSGTLMEVQILHPAIFLEPLAYADTLARYGEQYLLYAPQFFFGVFDLLFPFCLGAWSVGWTLQDMWLIAYKLPKADVKEFFEIEPSHNAYNNFIGGYAGLSALAFYIGGLLFFLHPGSPGFYISLVSNSIPLFSMVIIALFSIAAIVPAYLLYCVTGFTRLRKGLDTCEGISDTEFRKFLTKKGYKRP